MEALRLGVTATRTACRATTYVYNTEEEVSGPSGPSGEWPKWRVNPLESVLRIVAAAVRQLTN